MNVDGQDVVKKVTSTVDIIVYSDRNDEKHKRGVAIKMSRNVINDMIEYAIVNKRIVRAHFKARQRNLTITQWYALTNEAEDEEKQSSV